MELSSTTKFVKFDVFINDNLKEGVVAMPCSPEYAGGFAQIPHGDVNKMPISSATTFGLKELLQDTNMTDKEYATVTFVPRKGCEDLTIGQITIINPEP
ncbi:putative catechol oxidase [Helianthus anomalus]